MIPDLKDQEQLIKLSEKGIYLEGNILKVITSDNEPFTKYLQEAVTKDRETRRKRLEITKQVQEQNFELLKSQESNEQLLRELKEALQDAERAKLTAETDLDLLQKRIQYELMGMIVRTALGIILGVGVISTVLYIIAIYKNQELALIGNTWSSMLGILLTNSFSIVGTIMGVKYATERPK